MLPLASGRVWGTGLRGLLAWFCNLPPPAREQPRGHRHADVCTSQLRPDVRWPPQRQAQYQLVTPLLAQPPSCPIRCDEIPELRPPSQPAASSSAPYHLSGHPPWTAPPPSCLSGFSLRGCGLWLGLSSCPGLWCLVSSDGYHTGPFGNISAKSEQARQCWVFNGQMVSPLCTKTCVQESPVAKDQKEPKSPPGALLKCLRAAMCGIRVT